MCVSGCSAHTQTHRERRAGAGGGTFVEREDGNHSDGAPLLGVEVASTADRPETRLAVTDETSHFSTFKKCGIWDQNKIHPDFLGSFIS